MNTHSDEHARYSVQLKDVELETSETSDGGATVQVFSARVHETFAGARLSYDEAAVAWMRMEKGRGCDVEMPELDAASAGLARAGADGDGFDALDEGMRNQVTCVAFLEAIETQELA